MSNKNEPTKTYLSPELKDLPKSEIKARLAAVGSRGFFNPRLKVDLPDNIHGEWVRNDPMAIAEKQAKGFIIDTEFATKSAITSTDGKPIVGDVIHMITSKDVKEVLDELHNEEFVRRHGKKTNDNTFTGEQIEQKEVASGLKVSDGIRLINESSSAVITSQAINEALKS